MNQHLLNVTTFGKISEVLFSLSSNFYTTLILCQDTPASQLLSQIVIQLNELDDGSFKSINQMRSTLH